MVRELWSISAMSLMWCLQSRTPNPSRTYDYHGGGWEPGAVNFHAPWQDVLVSDWLGSGDSRHCRLPSAAGAMHQALVCAPAACLSAPQTGPAVGAPV